MPAENTITDKVVRLELERILAFNQFANSPNLSKFIAYVVEAKLNGNEADLKAYSIAVDALGRPETFDSQTDPSVRVLAGRVRSALRDFYTQNDEPGDISITIPKGSYRPEFSSTGPPQSKVSKQKELLDNRSIPVVERSVIFSLPFWVAFCVIILLVFALVTYFDTSQEKQTHLKNANNTHKLSIMIKDDSYQSLSVEAMDQARRFSSELRASLSDNTSVSIFLPPKNGMIDTLSDIDFVISNSWTPVGTTLRVRVEVMNARTNALVYSEVASMQKTANDGLSSISSAVTTISRQLNSEFFGIPVDDLAGRETKN